MAMPSAISHGEAKLLELTRKSGIGAQFGGKYFCHDAARDQASAPWRVLPRGDRRLLFGRPGS